MRRLLFLLPLAAFLGVAIYLGVGLTRDPSTIPSALIDQPVPAFTLPPLDKTGVPGFDDAALRRGRVALVNVFASWCVPCRAEHPLLMRLAREGRVPVYGINYKDWAPEAAKWLAELGNPYAAIGYDDTGRIGIEWGVYGVPETFIIDRRGRIRHRHVGPLTPETMERTIRPLIAALDKP